MLAWQRRVLPSNHRDTAITMGNVASTFRKLGRHSEALPLQEEVLVRRLCLTMIGS